MADVALEKLAGVLAKRPGIKDPANPVKLTSVRGDIAEDCWRIIAPVVAAWRKGRVPLDSYPAGSRGPKSWR